MLGCLNDAKGIETSQIVVGHQGDINNTPCWVTFFQELMQD